LKMNSKKAITLLVLTTLLLGMIPVVSVNALTIDDLYDTNGNKIAGGSYGDTVVVNGTDVTAGYLVKVYWDYVQTWDGEGGLLNSSKAKNSGDFEVWFEIPEATNGTHYVWVEDAKTGEAKKIQIIVNPLVEVSPESGLPGDTITLKGYGFAAEEEITITDDFVNTTGGALNATYGTVESSTLGSWTTTFKVPTDTDYADNYNITAKDASADEDVVNFKVGASVSLNKDSGPTGTVVRASGRGFNDNGELWFVQIWNTTGLISNCTVLDDDDLDISGRGLFTLDLVIPGVDYAGDDYYLKFVDDAGNIGESRLRSYRSTRDRDNSRIWGCRKHCYGKGLQLYTG